MAREKLPGGILTVGVLNIVFGALCAFCGTLGVIFKASGSDFLAVVCREVEDVSASVEALGVRRVVVRTGIVLARNEGALRFMTPIFKLSPGAPIGSKGRFGSLAKALEGPDTSIVPDEERNMDRLLEILVEVKGIGVTTFHRRSTVAKLKKTPCSRPSNARTG